MSWRIYMNKYDQKVIEFAPKNAKIYELTRKKAHGKNGQVLELIFESVLSFGNAVKQLEERDAYYLVMENQRALLYKIERNLNLSQKDITDTVQLLSGKKDFILEGFKYKLFRKLN